jgi:hypothetical protein
MNTVLPGKITQRFIQPFSTEFLEIAVFEEVILLHLFPADLSAVKAVSSRE